jgi:hypothetical protein
MLRGRHGHDLDRLDIDRADNDILEPLLRMRQRVVFGVLYVPAPTTLNMAPAGAWRRPLAVLGGAFDVRTAGLAICDNGAHWPAQWFAKGIKSTAWRHEGAAKGSAVHAKSLAKRLTFASII